jgi:hypothetical protein
MFKRTSLFLILIFWQSHRVQGILQPVRPKKITEHFTEMFKSFMKNDYHLFNEVGGEQSHSLRYHTKEQIDHHLINIEIKESKEGYSYSLKNTKKKDIKKEYSCPYFKEEYDLQSPAFMELKNRLLSYDEDTPVIFFTTIEDVKQKILGLGDNNQDLLFEEDLVDQQIVLTLKSRENTIAVFTIKVTKSNSNTDYFLDIEFLVSNKNKQISQNTNINMFAKDDSIFKAGINTITNALRIIDYTNNVHLIHGAFAEYMNESFRNITTSSVRLENSDSEFSLKYEQQYASVKIVYLPLPRSEPGVAKYSIVITKDGKEFKNIKFLRMSKAEFKEHLKKLEIYSLFPDLWVEIKGLFCEAYTKTNKSSLDVNCVDDDKVENNWVKPNKTWVEVTAGNLRGTKLSYIIEDAEFWTVSWKSPFESKLKVSFQFKKGDFDRSGMQQWLDFVVIKPASSEIKPQSV